MKNVSRVVYSIKLILFITQFYFMFLMLHNILDTRIYGIVFLLFYFIFAIKEILELLSKKERFKNDIIYNIMKIGVYGYLLFISIKTYLSKIYVTRITMNYFIINYIILSLLIIFIIIYSYLEFKSSKK